MSATGWLNVWSWKRMARLTQSLSSRCLLIALALCVIGCSSTSKPSACVVPCAPAVVASSPASAYTDTCIARDDLYLLVDRLDRLQRIGEAYETKLAMRDSMLEAERKECDRPLLNWKALFIGAAVGAGAAVYFR